MQIIRRIAAPIYPPGSDWFNGVLAGMDTETTGLDTASARIVSASLVFDTPGEEPIILEWLLNPVVEIPLEATAVHGISTEHARKHGMDAATGIAGIMTALSRVNVPLVMVNCSYDLSILYCESLRHGIDVSPIGRVKVIDTLVCDRMLDPWRPGRRTLTAVSAAHGIAIRGAHQATGDVLTAIRLARALGARHPDFGHADIDSLQSTQANAFAKWATEYRDYRRSDNEPDFDLSTDWPCQAMLPIDVR